MRNADSTEPVQLRRQATLCKKFLKIYHRDTIAYNRDCNARFLGRGKTDKKRDRLQLKAHQAFKNMFLAYGKLLSLAAKYS